LVIWPVKIVPEMTYYVLSGTLSLYTITITICLFVCPSTGLCGKFSSDFHETL